MLVNRRPTRPDAATGRDSATGTRLAVRSAGMVTMQSIVENGRANKVSDEHLDVIVIGGGQAGLAVGSYLAKQGQRFLILDAGKRVGDIWRNRWDSLRLFTPAR